MICSTLIRHGNTFVIEGQDSIEACRKIKEGQAVKGTFSVPRSLGHHRLFFALLTLVYEAQEEPRLFPSVEALLECLKIALGHVREMKDLEGNLHFIPKSIDFASMSQGEFCQFFDRSVDVILKHILPNSTQEGLEEAIFQTLGEPTPSMMRR